VLALLAVGLWSTVATAFKLSLRELEPVQLLFWSALASSLVLFAWLGRKHQLGLLWPTFRQQPGLYLLLGLLNPFLYYLVLFAAYDRLPAQQAQTINYTWAITLGLASVPFLKRHYGARDAIAAVLGYLGVLLIATRGDLLALQFDSISGVVLALGSTLIWAAYWIMHTRMRADPVLGLCLCFFCGLPLIAAAALTLSDLHLPNLHALAGAAYVGVFEMGITYVIWLVALRSATNIARISNLIFLSPLLSLFFIGTLLNEPILPATLAGLGLILLGTFIQQFRRAAAQEPVG